MAAGGYGTGSGVPLHQRRRTDQEEAPVPIEPVEPVEPAGDQSRHCWLALPVDSSHARAALLLEWRRVERGRFEGRVVYQAELRPGRWSLVEEWVPAELLTPRDETG